jgi:hypothetical protein
MTFQIDGSKVSMTDAHLYQNLQIAGLELGGIQAPLQDITTRPKGFDRRRFTS